MPEQGAGNGHASNFQKMEDPYEKGRRLERERVRNGEMEGEWRSLCQQVAATGELHDLQRCLRFLLVEAFGSKHDYLLDATFHAKVEHAERRLLNLLEAW